VFSEKWFPKFWNKELSASSRYMLSEVGKVASYVGEVWGRERHGWPIRDKDITPVSVPMVP
jgi:hypothetical protein